MVPKDPYPGGDHLQAIEKPQYLHGRSLGPWGVMGGSRAIWASILGGFVGAPGLQGAATSGQANTVTTLGGLLSQRPAASGSGRTDHITGCSPGVTRPTPGPQPVMLL